MAGFPGMIGGKMPLPERLNVEQSDLADFGKY
jgi:hypothetical protein